MRRGPVRLVVDPTACDGSGVCAELLPEWVEVDPWGYPILPRGPIPPELAGLARRATASCPKLALTLVQETR
jgi:ferredoxin